MPELAAGSVDLIAADLPYGVTACAWDSVIPFAPLWEQFKRIIKPNGAIVLTSAQPFTSVLTMSNIKNWRCEWVWHKTLAGGFLNANRHPLRLHENVQVFCYGKVNYNPQMTTGKSYSALRKSLGLQVCQSQNVKSIPTVNKGDRYPVSVQVFSNDTGLHPTQKPVALIEYLIRTYSNPGDLVLDNCMGSGTAAIACIRSGRRFIGIEKNDVYFAAAQQRIRDTHRNLFFQEATV